MTEANRMRRGLLTMLAYAVAVSAIHVALLLWLFSPIRFVEEARPYWSPRAGEVQADRDHQAGHLQLFEVVDTPRLSGEVLRRNDEGFDVVGFPDLSSPRPSNWIEYLFLPYSGPESSEAFVEAYNSRMRELQHSLEQ